MPHPSTVREYFHLFSDMRAAPGIELSSWRQQQLIILQGERHDIFQTQCGLQTNPNPVGVE